MVESLAARTEFQDPIIYSLHPDVEALLSSKQTIGLEYDQQNNSSIYNSLPMWIREEDASQQNALKLTQVMSSYLDTLQNQITEVKNIKNVSYPSGSEKPYNFVKRNVQNLGFDTADFFVDANVLERFMAARTEISTVAISGAVGTFANIDPSVEEHVGKKMGLIPEPLSTQVIPRDRHAMFFSILGVIASSLERLAVEIRHMQRTELREAEEYFSPGQKGSSAMPHKRNPVLTENITGLARGVRSSVIPALENVALWHERDISHSSVERMIGPDATITLDFAIARMTGVIKKLMVYPNMMQRNLDALGGLVFSQRVLLALTQAGMSREAAYNAVQRNAMKVWKEGADFLNELKADKEVLEKISTEELSELFDIGYHIKNIDKIFSRVFGEC